MMRFYERYELVFLWGLITLHSLTAALNQVAEGHFGFLFGLSAFSVVAGVTVIILELVFNKRKVKRGE